MQATTGRRCVFCHSPANSGEHVFAKRLCKRAGAIRFNVITGLAIDGKAPITRPPHHLEAFTVRHVCTRCNNGWMNDLEIWFERHLGFLIEPQWPKLALPMIDALKIENNELARWLMKTAVMFNLATLRGENRVEFEHAVLLEAHPPQKQQ